MEERTRERTIIVGVPKGRFEVESRRLLTHFSGSDMIENRQLSYRLHRDDHDLVIKFMKMPDIARLLSAGEIDAGILCDEWAFEHDLHAELRPELNWCRSDIVLAAPAAAGLPPSGRLSVATTFPRLAHHLLKHQMPDNRYVYLTGSTEAAVPELADAIVDCVESGRTLADNGLVPMLWLTTTNVRLFIGTNSAPQTSRIASEIEAVARKQAPPFVVPHPSQDPILKPAG